MTLTRFQRAWFENAEKLSLRVQAPFVLELEEGEVSVPVLLRDFGAAQGMLLVTDYGLISPYIDQIGDLGFGFSCLGEPTQVAHPDDDKALMEMLADWGWSETQRPPEWYREPTS